MMHSNVLLTGFFPPYKTAISAAYVVVFSVLLDITFSLFSIRADNDAPHIFADRKKDDLNNDLNHEVFYVF